MLATLITVLVIGVGLPIEKGPPPDQACGPRILIGRARGGRFSCCSASDAMCWRRQAI